MKNKRAWYVRGLYILEVVLILFFLFPWLVEIVYAFFFPEEHPSVSLPTDVQCLSLIDDFFTLDDSHNGLEVPECPEHPENSRLILATPNGSIPISIVVGELVAVDGLWSSDQATVIATGALNGEIYVDNLEQRDWGDTLSAKASYAYPYVRVLLPINVEQHIHQWIDLEVTMDVIYPKPMGSVNFSNRQQRFFRTIHLFVIDENDIEKTDPTNALNEYYGEPLYYKVILPLVLFFAIVIGVVLFYIDIKPFYEQFKRTWGRGP